MKAIEILKQDHERISSLIHELEVIDGSARDPERQSVFTNLKNTIKLHDRIKKAIFYPALKKIDETRDLVEKSHAELRRIEKTLSAMERGQGDWEDNLSNLKEDVQNHIGKNESELFPAAEKVLGESHLKEMGAKIKKLIKEATAGA